MIGTFDGLVIDCDRPQLLGDFYAELLGMRKFGDERDWSEVYGPDHSRPLLAFRRVENYSRPQWPGQRVPQQMHIDVKVDDLETGEAAVLALGATATGSGSDVYRVYLDPDGHPFCLIKPND